MMENRTWNAEELAEAIEFHSEDIDFSLEQADTLRQWVKRIIDQENKILEHISYIFCNDAYLYELNLQYLNHDTLTDIITFQYAKLPVVEGDIFISINRIRENAAQYEVTFDNELHRVMSHGVLHLCGYGDKKNEEKKRMTEKENGAISLLSEIFAEKK